jgi:hypothetical protein
MEFLFKSASLKFFASLRLGVLAVIKGSNSTGGNPQVIVRTILNHSSSVKVSARRWRSISARQRMMLAPPCFLINS